MTDDLAERVARSIKFSLTGEHCFRIEDEYMNMARAAIAAMPARSLGDYSDMEIANEHHRRAMKFLGDQRVGVIVPSPAIKGPGR